MQRDGNRKYQWFLIFCTGLAVGAVIACFWTDMETAQNSSIISYLKMMNDTNTQGMGTFIFVCIRRLMTAAALAGMIYMFHTPVGFYILTLLLGSAFGYLMAVLAMVYSLKSCLAMIVLMMPQYLFYIPVYIIYLKLADAKAASSHKSTFNNGGHKILAIIGSAVFILVLAGSLMESYVNPLFVKKIVKIF